jgi:hypothetical protein
VSVLWVVTPCGLAEEHFAPMIGFELDAVCSTTGIRFPAGTWVFIIATAFRLGTEVHQIGCVNRFIWVKAFGA